MQDLLIKVDPKLVESSAATHPFLAMRAAVCV
jgi:hypothetical protein